MNELIYADGNDANMRYACGLDAPDPFTYFSIGAERFVIVSPLEYSRALEDVHGQVRVFCTDEFPGAAGTVSLIVAAADKYHCREFAVPDTFPLSLARKLEKEGLKLSLKEGGFFPQRRCKSAQEASFIRRAMELTAKAMRKARDVLADASADGKKQLVFENELLTSEKMRFIINCELLAGGGFSDSTIVAGGVQGSQPHNHGSGVLFATQPIVIDIFPRMTASGYYGDMTRTFVKGTASPIVKKAFEAVKTARDEAKLIIKAGIECACVHRRALDILTDAGFATVSTGGRHEGFFHGLGHGLGLEIHEAPRLSLRVDNCLRAGDVVTVEPGLYYGQWGGIRLEDVVLVTEEGCECLTDFETVLELD